MSHSWGGSVCRYLMIAEDYKGKWWDQSENKKKRVSLFFLFSPSNPYFYLFINYPNYFALILVNWAHSKKTVLLHSDPVNQATQWPPSLTKEASGTKPSQQKAPYSGGHHWTDNSPPHSWELQHKRGNLITLNTKICLKLKVSFDLKVVNIF